jgi:hypothetical protein
MSNLPWNPQQPALPPMMYANAVQVMFSPWDLMLDFIQLAAVQQMTEGENGEQRTETVTATQGVQRVVMSPQHAKAFLRILKENLDNYEKLYGEIPTITVGEEPR